jgi:hypothetical protein
MTIGFAQPAPLSLADLETSGEGFAAQVCPREQVSSTAIPSLGSARCCLLALRKGAVLTTAYVIVSANGAGVTLFKIGLWLPSTGAVLAATVDMSAGVNAGSVPRGQSGALTAPFTVPADGAYYAGVVQAGGTGATLGLASPGAIAAASWSPGSQPIAAGQAAMVDVTAFAPPLASSSTLPWIAFA